MRSGDDTIEWDSEIVNDEPSKRIVWRSIGGDSDNAGEVIFESAPGERGTIVTVLQEFRMGKLASLWETIVWPKSQAGSHRESTPLQSPCGDG